jgi:hypothetical protein
VKREPKSIPASVKPRLLKLSGDRKEDFNLTLTRYASERFLYRLGKSPCRQDYVLKGAMLLTAILDRWRYRPVKTQTDSCSVRHTPSWNTVQRDSVESISQKD